MPERRLTEMTDRINAIEGKRSQLKRDIRQLEQQLKGPEFPRVSFAAYISFVCTCFFLLVLTVYASVFGTPVVIPLGSFAFLFGLAILCLRKHRKSQAAKTIASAESAKDLVAILSRVPPYSALARMVAAANEPICRAAIELREAEVNEANSQIKKMKDEELDLWAEVMPLRKSVKNLACTHHWTQCDMRGGRRYEEFTFTCGRCGAVETRSRDNVEVWVKNNNVAGEANPLSRLDARVDHL